MYRGILTQTHSKLCFTVYVNKFRDENTCENRKRPFLNELKETESNEDAPMHHSVCSAGGNKNDVSFSPLGQSQGRSGKSSTADRCHFCHPSPHQGHTEGASLGNRPFKTAENLNLGQRTRAGRGGLDPPPPPTRRLHRVKET